MSETSFPRAAVRALAGRRAASRPPLVATAARPGQGRDTHHRRGWGVPLLRSRKALRRPRVADHEEAEVLHAPGAVDPAVGGAAPEDRGPRWRRSLPEGLPAHHP